MFARLPPALTLVRVLRVLIDTAYLCKLQQGIVAVTGQLGGASIFGTTHDLCGDLCVIFSSYSFFAILIGLAAPAVNRA